MTQKDWGEENQGMLTGATWLDECQSAYLWGRKPRHSWADPPESLDNWSFKTHPFHPWRINFTLTPPPETP
ncbi:unnamed protein product [Torque teno tamarin virus]|uniref:Uncharacterized ORF4 protein n=1 Tax=Torque teno tamarin virus (isolate So-TTV2) TaxID=766186 RepID=ORF4_TTVE1|nr:hypothetical protein TTtaV_gp4 [Torque teno tamarin virus]Q9DUB9.1 RecName: Full=Uncharacterized ORF4 protein [Torque teno tamarin virus (isolate So-TTV2)]BAB19318.1 unnamed protein product [Torque teno tamarin virus]